MKNKQEIQRKRSQKQSQGKTPVKQNGPEMLNKRAQQHKTMNAAKKHKYY